MLCVVSGWRYVSCRERGSSLRVVLGRGHSALGSSSKIVWWPHAGRGHLIAISGAKTSYGNMVCRSSRKVLERFLLGVCARVFTESVLDYAGASKFRTSGGSL